MVMTFSNDINAVFSRNLRVARISQNISQEELANRCGLARTYISAVERGERNISLRNVQRIAAALGISESELLDRSNG